MSLNPIAGLASLGGMLGGRMAASVVADLPAVIRPPQPAVAVTYTAACPACGQDATWTGAQVPRLVQPGEPHPHGARVGDTHGVTLALTIACPTDGCVDGSATRLRSTAEVAGDRATQAA